MSKQIKIGDRVVYSPSLAPLVGEVVGIMGNYVTLRSEDDVIITKPVEEYCLITDEEYNRFRKLKGELEMATNLSSEETRELIEQQKEESEE